MVTYDARSSNDPVWGLGLGCEGAMSILVQRLDAAGSYHPFEFIAHCNERQVAGAVALVVESQARRIPPGTAWHSAASDSAAPAAEIIERCRQRARQGGFENFTAGAPGQWASPNVSKGGHPGRGLGALPLKLTPRMRLKEA